MDLIITELTLENIQKTVDENPCVIIDFWGDDCSYCKIIIPELEKFALQNLGQCVFTKLRVDLIGRSFQNDSMSEVYPPLSSIWTEKKLDEH